MSATLFVADNIALVLSVDEKSQIQALDREQPVLPMMLGVPERRTHSYIRHGTCYLPALERMSPRVLSSANAGVERHRATEFLIVKRIDAQVPNGLDVHIIMDKPSTLPS